MGRTEKTVAEKWDSAAKLFDIMNTGVELRFGEAKRGWFSGAAGKTLLAAVGTGLDLQYFPPGSHVYGIDISSKMLEKAGEKKRLASLDVKLIRADVQELGFADNAFDTVVTSCTFCSVPDPLMGLTELLRVIKTGGKLLMFEHVRSNIFWMGPMMDALTVLTRNLGPELNRRTGENIIKAGFKLTREVNAYLDMVKFFEAVKP